MEKGKKEFRETNLETDLKNQEVQERIATYGYNEVPEKKIGFLTRLGKRFWGLTAWMAEIAILTSFV